MQWNIALVVLSVDDNIYLVKRDENGLFGYTDNEDNTLIETKV